MEPETIGEQIRTARERRGMSQRELARRSDGGISLAGLSRIESGGRQPSLLSLEAITRVLGATITIRRGVTRLSLRKTKEG